MVIEKRVILPKGKGLHKFLQVYHDNKPYLISGKKLDSYKKIEDYILNELEFKLKYLKDGPTILKDGKKISFVGRGYILKGADCIYISGGFFNSIFGFMFNSIDYEHIDKIKEYLPNKIKRIEKL